MVTYTTSAIVSAQIGITISATSRPNTTQMTVFLAEADKKINGEMKNEGENITDNTGALSPIAAALCVKMVNNLFAHAEPDSYAMVEVEMTEADKRTIHLTYSKWQILSWKMGG